MIQANVEILEAEATQRLVELGGAAIAYWSIRHDRKMGAPALEALKAAAGRYDQAVRLLREAEGKSTRLAGDPPSR